MQLSELNTGDVYLYDRKLYVFFQDGGFRFADGAGIKAAYSDSIASSGEFLFNLHKVTQPLIEDADRYMAVKA